MNAYVALFKARFLVLLQYRLAAFAGIATQVFWGVILVMIMTAFYDQTQRAEPLTLKEASTFIWLNQALLGLVPWNVDKEIQAMIKNGNVAYVLIRPLGLYWQWFCTSIAMRLVPTLLRSIPLFIIAGTFFDLSRPDTQEALVAFVCSLFFSVLLSGALTTLIIATLFWTISGEGILRLTPHIVVILSGLVVPLPLFPDGFQMFLSIQPFRFILDVPCRLYTGVIASSDALYFIAMQALWVAVTIYCGRYLMSRAMRKLIIQGG